MLGSLAAGSISAQRVVEAVLLRFVQAGARPRIPGRLRPVAGRGQLVAAGAVTGLRGCELQLDFHLTFTLALGPASTFDLHLALMV